MVDEYSVPTLLLAVPAGPARERAARARWPELVPLVDAAVGKPTKVAKIPAAALTAAFLMVPLPDAERLATADRRSSARHALERVQAWAVTPTPCVTVEGTTVHAIEATEPVELWSTVTELARVLRSDSAFQPAPSALAVLDAVLDVEPTSRAYTTTAWVAPLLLARPDLLPQLSPFGPAGVLVLSALDGDPAKVAAVIDAAAVRDDARAGFAATWNDGGELRWMSPALLLLGDRLLGDDAAPLLRQRSARFRRNQLRWLLEILDLVQSPVLRAAAIKVLLAEESGIIETEAGYHLARRHLPLDRISRLVTGSALLAWLAEAPAALRREWLNTEPYSALNLAYTGCYGPARETLIAEAYEALPGVFSADRGARFLQDVVIEQLMVRAATEIDAVPEPAAAWSLFWQLSSSWSGSTADLVATVRATAA